MKKFMFILLLLLCCVMISSCQPLQKEPNYESSDLKYLLLGKSEETLGYNDSLEYFEFLSSVSAFSTDLSEKMISKYNNKYNQIAVSPISIYMALAMATSIAEAEAQMELSSLLGIPYDSMLEYTKYLYSMLNAEKYDDNQELAYMLSLNNSIWLNDKLSYKQEGLELLKDSFYTDSYAAPFTSNNDAANKAVHDFIFRNTKGLIDNEYSFDINTLFLLINTLYLKDAWNEFGEDLKYTTLKYEFKNNNSTTISTKLLQGSYIEGITQIGDGFEYFYTKTVNNLKLYFIKPTTKTLNEVYNQNNLNMILSDLDYNAYNYDLKEKYYTRCLFPEFNASFDEDILSLLKEEYGLSKIFRKDTANYSLVTDEPCSTSSIIHQTKLIVDKTGIEGAAVTIISNDLTSAPGDNYKTVVNDFVIDESFGFILTKNNAVLFSGVVNNLE